MTNRATRPHTPTYSAYHVSRWLNGRQNLDAINAVKLFAGLQKKKLSIIGMK